MLQAEASDEAAADVAVLAVALDDEEWPEVVGTISGDDTIFIATPGVRAQRRLIERLQSTFRI